MKLRVPNSGPPGGVWAYQDPDLGMRIEHYGMIEDFPRLVNEARTRNGKVLINHAELLQLILAQVCANAPAGFCRGDGAPAGRSIFTVAGISNASRTLVAMLRARASGEELYNSDPNAAAKVCSTCPLNRREFCGTCTGLESIARSMLRATQTTSYDGVLGACEACGCMLRLKVHFSPTVLRRSVLARDRDKYHPDCWIFKNE